MEVLLRFSRIKIRSSWHQQEFTRFFLCQPSYPGSIYFLGLFDREGMLFPGKCLRHIFVCSQPSHPGSICFSVCLIEKVCCSQESDCGTFLYNSARGVEGGIWLCMAMA